MFRLPYLLLMSALMLGSCVSTKKYDAALMEQDRLRKKIEELKSVEKELRDCQIERATVQSQYAESVANYEDLLARYQDLNERHVELGKKFREQVEQNSELLENSSTQVVELYEKLDATKDSMVFYRKNMNECQASLMMREKETAALKDSIQKNQKRIAGLENMLSSRKNQMDELRKNLREALVGFSAADLSISQKEGRLYVSMSQELLFKSGSDQIDKQGKDAIGKLAVVLKNKPELDIIVEGHTDSDGSVNYNWDLSVERASEVVKLLVENQVRPDKVTACGRGEHQPVATNDTAAGKAKNRRTEIIIAPDLSQLYKLMYEDNE